MSQQINITEEQYENAKAVMVSALDVGEGGTRGDYTELGLLTKLFSVLDLTVVIEPITAVGKD